MSKGGKHHSRDRIATDALRNIFPKEWHFKSSRDVDGGREYSEDWIIEIVDEDENPTEIEFGIQNKTDVKITKKYASIRLEMSDIQRLLRLKRLILIHAYHIDTKTSYWTWLNEWYPKNYKPAWKNQKSLTVNIPLDQIMDGQVVERIRQKAWWDHQKRHAEKLGEIISQTYPNDYQVEVQTGETFITTIINPKHEGAIPIIQPLDDETSKVLSMALDLGIAVQPAHFSIGNLPSFIADNTFTQIEQAIIFPITSQLPIPLRIDYLNENNECIFSSPYVIMHLIQPGQIVQVWVGRDENRKVTYTFETNLEQQTEAFTVKFDKPDIHDVIRLNKLFEILDTVRPVHRFQITKLESDEISYKDGTGFFKEPTFKLQVLKRLTKALKVINDKLGRNTSIPKRFDEKILFWAEWTAEALVNGTAPEPRSSDRILPEVNLFIVPSSPTIARKILSDYEDVGKVYLMLGQPQEIIVELLDQKFNLGNAIHYVQAKPVHIEELKVFLAQENITDETIVVFTYCEIDRDTVRLQFYDWFQNQRA